ncbi:MAG TPA: hypothetical protein VM682_03140 [Bacillus sp. (in: firmicutes)]|nr:hypothetical protein [Bacillus sp. (in: firmicutes)]
MLPWKSPVLSKVAISNGFFRLKLKTSVFVAHPKITRPKNVMLSKKEEEELSQKMYKITMRNLSPLAMSNLHHQNLKDPFPPDLTPVLTLAPEVDKVTTTMLIIKGPWPVIISINRMITRT